MWRGVFYFLLATSSDLLITLYYRFISSGQDIWASILAVIITFVPMALTYKIVEMKRRSLIFIYALGAGLGTWLGMKIL